MESECSAGEAPNGRPHDRQRTRSAETRAREQQRAARDGRQGRGGQSIFTPDAFGALTATAAAKVAQSLRDAMGAWPTPTAKGQAAPPHASAGPNGGGPAYSAAPSAPVPFSAEQSAWLRSAVADTMGVALERFGRHLDAELSTIREGVSAAHFEAAEASVLASSAKSGVQAQSSTITDLATRVAELEKRARQGGDAASSSGASSVPYEQRQLAIVGNLGPE